jgi:hypothetical protein
MKVNFRSFFSPTARPSLLRSFLTGLSLNLAISLDMFPN